MAASGRFDMSLSRADVPPYATGQRGGPYVAGPLERSGSFREVSDRVVPLPVGTSKSSAITPQGDMTSLFHSLASDLKGIVSDPKLNRPGEMKRAITSIFGASTENSTSTSFDSKPFPSSSLEEIKRLKSNLQENSTKARDRARNFGAACSLIDKLWLLKRKRSRIGSSPSERTSGLFQGANIPKIGPQSNVSGNNLENGSQREDKPKIGIPNRRTRTSLLDMDTQTSSATRSSGPLERDKDMSKAVNGSATQLAENDGAFSAVSDGWERSKLKKKRSVIKSDALTSSGLVRSHGGEREVKRGMQQKLGIDARQKNNHAHSFRLGSDSGTTAMDNSDPIPQQHVTSIRSRNESNNGSLLNERRDPRFGPDTDSTSLKAIGKPNNREDRCVANPAFLKFGSFRPRTNAGSLTKSTSNIHRVVGNCEDEELPQSTDKLNVFCVNNRKRAACVRSSSPPVGQWAVHRPKKYSRSTRRSSLSPLVSSHDDLAVSEAVDEEPTNHDSLGAARRTSSNASQPSKMRGDNSASASLSESEESGVQENKLQYNVNKCTEKEDKSGQPVQKSTNLIVPPRKNRMAIEEDIGDSDRRQGRIGRGFTPARSGLSARSEKLGDVVTAKQQRSVRHGSDRIESKPGRPPIKKLSERKACTRPRQSINALSVESSEEPVDDHEELVAAATAALETGRACSGPLWKQLEPVFGTVSSEDAAFLLEQIQLTNESTPRTYGHGNISQNLKVDHEKATILVGPPVISTCKNNGLSDGNSFYKHEIERGFAKERVLTDPLLNEVISQSGPLGGVSICQVLLSAIIEEDDIEKIYNKGDFGEEYLYEDCTPAQFEVANDMKPKVLNLSLMEGNQDTRRSSDYCKVNTNWRGTNGIPVSSLQQASGQLVVPKQTTLLSTGCTEFQYNQMSINDRIILELREIGLYPEVDPVPDFRYDDDIDLAEKIHTLEESLHEKAANRKNTLLKLEKAVRDDSEVQRRKLEQSAMKHLVQIAYDRYMACWGPSSSGTKNATKSAKHSTQTFMKQVLARYKKFEETGITCFNEPIFRDIFLSASSGCSNPQSMDAPANDRNPSTSSQPMRKADTNVKCSDAAPDHPLSKDNAWSNRPKKKELLLDDVACGTAVPSSRPPSGLGNPPMSGTKGKRSERDRDSKVQLKNGPAKIGRTSTSNGGVKGERKNKPKPKTKTTHLSASANVCHTKTAEADSNPLPSSGTNKPSIDNNVIGLGNLPDIDVGVFGSNAQDLSSWFNFEDDGLQDHDDCMGLEIPMDDLSDVHMMI